MFFGNAIAHFFRKPPAIDTDWVEFCPRRKMSEEQWKRLEAMIDPREMRVIAYSSGEDSQGLWIQHRVLISPLGIFNVYRCDEVLTDLRTGDFPQTSFVGRRSNSVGAISG
jgi:hypothetical protein